VWLSSQEATVFLFKDFQLITQSANLYQIGLEQQSDQWTILVFLELPSEQIIMK
jgi:hypothetical protein